MAEPGPLRGAQTGGSPWPELGGGDDWRRLADVPGKLMIAGEYAVLRPDGLAVAVAVGRVVQVCLRPSPAPLLTLHAFDRQWQAAAEDLAATPQLHHGLQQVAAQALRWLRDTQGLSLTEDLRLDVHGAVGGQKVGLGTSAAVTVACVRAVLVSAGLPAPSERVAAWSRAIHAQSQGSLGSGYDVTTIAYGGAIAYRRQPDRAQPLGWPSDLYAAALFTGVAAPTRPALDRTLPAAALDGIRDAAVRLHAAWASGGSAVVAAASDCEVALEAAAGACPDLLPEAVRGLRDHITGHGCTARTSGAGGGDCVLALSSDPASLDRTVTAWQARGGHVAARMPSDLAPSGGTP